MIIECVTSSRRLSLGLRSKCVSRLLFYRCNLTHLFRLCMNMVFGVGFVSWNGSLPLRVKC